MCFVSRIQNMKPITVILSLFNASTRCLTSTSHFYYLPSFNTFHLISFISDIMAAKQIPTIELWKCRENNKNPSGSEFNITLSDKLVTLSIKSVCQVVEEEITALIFVEPGKCFEAVSSLSSSLGIPLLVLDSSGVIQRIYPAQSWRRLH